MFHFEVSPRRSATAFVTVHVADVNDNAPTFTHAHYRARIAENEAAGRVTSLSSIRAEDADAGENGEIRFVSQSLTSAFHVSVMTQCFGFRYVLVSGSDGKFDIDPQNGDVFLLEPLDREERDVYELQVRAVDGGMAPKSSDVTVTIHVDDVNDNRPQFLKDTYKFYIKDPLEFGEFNSGFFLCILVRVGRTSKIHKRRTSTLSHFINIKPAFWVHRIESSNCIEFPS